MPYYPPSSSGGATTTASNSGAGAGVFATVTGDNLAFRSLVAGTNINITSSATEITISGPAGSGEANTASNLGAGTGIYSTKVGVDLQFKSLIAGSNITLTTTANDITIASTGGGGSTTTVSAIEILFSLSSAPPSTPASGNMSLYATAGGLGLLNNSAVSYQIFDGWRGVLTTSTISSSVTPASTGLVSATLPVGYYQWHVAGAFQSNTTTCGFGARINVGNATIAEIFGTWSVTQAANGTDSRYEYAQLLTTTDVASASVVAANTKYPFLGSGWFRISAQGTVLLQFRSEVASPSQVTLSTGTSMRITRVG